MATSIKKEMEPTAVDRVLRCRKTSRYFDGDGWCEDPRQACTFSDEMEAVRACLAHNLQDVELVLRSQGADADLFCTTIR